MFSTKIIARATMPTPLALSEENQSGLGQITNEDPTTQARILFSGSPTAPSVEDVMLGARLYAAGGVQEQIQAVNDGTRLDRVWVAVCPHHAVAPAASIAADFADVLLVGANNRAVSGKITGLAATFTQPDVNATVQITVADSTIFAAEDTIFVEGGTIYTVVSVSDGSDATKMTITNTGEAAAVVTLCES
jgi:hypothetical protein